MGLPETSDPVVDKGFSSTDDSGIALVEVAEVPYLLVHGLDKGIITIVGSSYSSPKDSLRASDFTHAFILTLAGPKLHHSTATIMTPILWI